MIIKKLSVVAFAVAIFLSIMISVEADELIELDAASVHNINEPYTVSAVEAVESVGLFADGVLLEVDEEAPFEFDVSGLELGTRHIKAEGYIGGDIAESCEKSVKLILAKDTTSIETDYSGTLPGGIAVPPKTNFSAGTSMFGGEDVYKAGTTAAGATSAYIAFSGLNITYGTVVYETKLYFSSTDIKSVIPSMIYSNNGSNASINDFVFQNGEVLLYKNGSLKQVSTFSAEEWYTIKYRVSFLSKVTYSAAMYDSDGSIVFEEKGLPAKVASNANFTKFIELRLKFETSADQEGFIMLDDSVLRFEQPMPYITNIGDENNRIGYDSHEIRVFTNGEFGAISPENISVSSIHGSLLVSDVQLEENGFTVYVSDDLDSATEYILRLDENCAAKDGSIFGIAASERFTTTPQDIDITSAMFDGDGDLSFTAELCNESGTEVALIGIMIVYRADTGRIEDIVSNKITVSGGTKTWSIQAPYPSDKYRAKCFVIDNYDNGMVLANKYYEVLR